MFFLKTIVFISICVVFYNSVLATGKIEHTTVPKQQSLVDVWPGGTAGIKMSEYTGLRFQSTGCV